MPAGIRRKKYIHHKYCRDKPKLWHRQGQAKVECPVEKGELELVQLVLSQSQKRIARGIVEADADYVLARKGTRKGCMRTSKAFWMKPWWKSKGCICREPNFPRGRDAADLADGGKGSAHRVHRDDAAA
jgi:hypothetical protein